MFLTISLNTHTTRERERNSACLRKNMSYELFGCEKKIIKIARFFVRKIKKINFSIPICGVYSMAANYYNIEY